MHYNADSHAKKTTSVLNDAIMPKRGFAKCLQLKGS